MTISDEHNNISNNLRNELHNQSRIETLNCNLTNETNRQALLIKAIDNEDLDMIRLMVNKFGIDINKQDDNGQTLLFHSANPDWENELESVEKSKAMHVLLELGAEVNVKDRWERTPLQYAVCIVGKVDSTRLLLEHGADVNATDNEGKTPLMFAVGSFINEGQNIIDDNSEIIRYLLEHGANPLIRDNKNKTVFNEIILNREIHEMLIEHCGFDDINDRQLLIYESCRYNEINIAKMLLERGIDVDAQGKDGRTPLHYAIRCSAVDIARLLLEYGADIDAQDKDGRTPLHLAATYDYSYESINLLLQHGADVDIRDNYGNTPLRLAVSHNLIDGVRLLLEHGADINAKDDYGWAPLQLALQAKFVGVNVVRLLVTHGADVNIKDNKGRTPLQFARYNRRHDVEQLLIEHGAEE